MSIFEPIQTCIKINGINVSVVIHITADHDGTLEAGSDFDFGSDEENRAYLKRFQSGELENVVIGVTAESHGVTGTDYLGGCHVHSSSKFKADIEEMLKEHDMIQNALNELKSNLVGQANALKCLASK